MSGDSSEEKKHQATDVKLQKQRDKGQIAKSADLYAVTAALTGFVMLMLLMDFFLGNIIMLFQASSQSLAFDFQNAYNYTTSALFYAFTFSVLPFFAVIIFAVIVSNLIYNKGIPFSFEPIAPKFQKLNPVQGFKNIFGKKGMITAAQSLVRLTIWLVGSLMILWAFIPALIKIPMCGVSCFAPAGNSLAAYLFGFTCVILFLVALFDMPVQKALFLMDQKMGDSEKKREERDVHGSPEIHSARSELRHEIAYGEGGDGSGGDGGFGGVDGRNLPPTVVIYSQTNAIAVHYDPNGDDGPVLVKKISENNLQELMEQAQAIDAPLHRDDEVADLLAGLPEGQVVPSQHYDDLAGAMIRSGVLS